MITLTLKNTPKLLAAIVIPVAFLLATVAVHSLAFPTPAAACLQNEVIENGTCVAKCAADEIYVTIAVDGDNHCVKKTTGNTVQQNIIFNWLVGIIRFLSAGVGIAVVGGIVYGGILYLTARDNSGQTQKAVTVIINAVIGLLLYIMMFAILNFLIPGGIFT
jgi:hypothetical protein